MAGKMMVALLRGINVGGHRKVPMAELRELCVAIGLEDVSSYVQSGNLVFRAAAAAAKVEFDLESAIEDHFGFAVPVLVRTETQWRKLIGKNPFSEASEQEPNRVALALAKSKAVKGAADELAPRIRGRERIQQVGEALWIHFADGTARSKLTPAALDQAAASPVTARNWRTVLKIEEMLRG